MHIDRDEIQEYPFDGVFYTSVIDKSLPLESQVEREVVLLETKCDITEASHSRVGEFIKAVYSVFVPFDKEALNPIEVNRGVMFRANMYGLPIEGKVEGVFPSQLGGFVAYVQANDV
jgi:hypothetical protein